MPRKHSDAAIEIGRRIREARGKQDCTREDLAHLAGIDVGNVGRIERGEVAPRVESLIRIATVLEIDPGHFVAGLDASSLPDGTEVYRVRDFLEERRSRTRH